MVGLVGFWTLRVLVILRRVVRGVWPCDVIRLEMIGVFDSDLVDDLKPVWSI